MIEILGQNNSILSQFLAEVRDQQIQQDRMRFRRNLERIGEVMAYELSKKLNYSAVDVTTPLGSAEMNLPDEPMVLATILRAGLPFHQGFLNYFDKAENAIISAYRKHSDDLKFEIWVEYLSSPDLTGKTLVLVDPMLATGKSMVLAYEALVEKRGQPASVHIAGVIASEDGLNYCRERMPAGTTFWLGAVDPELNAKSYIVPGLGDAGDLAYGGKV